MVKGFFALAALLVLVTAILMAYRAYLVRVKTEKELKEKEMEHEERKELFEDEDL